ncbi:ribosome biogenesis protein Nop16 [Fimicolochytrium jonesii]|uniref:ribosome biogenesis protein Nop16 n=1 Tax=Fimicolochytrium jonesii TaxID=1396493 RepID=UPI0022FE2A21|nr:ribosome biogenesis protein Nop16 [Fimicolochytrium jonesii]KAI8819312.1 ribosome biogenesis protein Nop16 [Fimicolochytrium jonesii]
MARPRGRRLNRAPSQKVSRKQKNPYDISFAGVHPLVRKTWDKKLTLKQNYERMGLVSALNGAAGGTEHAAADRAIELAAIEARKAEVEWRVIDASAPSVTTLLATEIADDDEDSEEDEDYDVEVDGPVQIDHRAKRIGRKIGLKSITADAPVAPKTAVIEAMEAQARDIVKLVRHASEQEGKVFGDLMRKHGRNYEAMAMDIKLNRFQLSAGQLRKRIERLIAA